MIRRSKLRFLIASVLTGTVVALLIWIGSTGAFPGFSGTTGSVASTDPAFTPLTFYDLSGGVSETIPLPETGAGNGIFYGPMPLSTGGAAAENGIIAAAATSSYEQQLPELSVSPNSLRGLLTKTGQGSDGSESQTLFSDQIPWDSVSSQFWETFPKNPSVALIEVDGEEIVSVSPGPDDMVRVIVQLKEDPVAIIKARTRGAQPSYAAAQAIRDHQQGVLEAHTTALAAMAK